MKAERIALAILLGILVLFPAALFGYQALRTRADGVRVIELTANTPDKGGWQPSSVQVQVGERVRLRLSSPDVVHGFAVPGLGLEVDEILPGHVQEVEFTAAQPGRYAFACTRWCSADHWRMRGVIEVGDPASPLHSGNGPREMPLYQQLGVDIDSPHPALNVPAATPSASAGRSRGLTLPPDLADANNLRTHSPSQVWGRLRAEPAYKGQSDQELWGLVAYAWQENAGSAALARGQTLFARDCAACHGEKGKGNGPAGLNLPGMAAMHPDMKRGPADFTNPQTMLGASDVLLQAKVLRGGMGTGMPEWRSLYSDADLWAVIAHVRSFLFAFDK